MSLVLETVFKAIHTLSATAWEDIPGYEEFANQLQNRQFIFELYEDNAGGLYLCILNQDYEFRCAFDEWQYDKDGTLKNALKSLTEDQMAYNAWGNDMLDDRHALTPLTADDLQRMYKNGDFGVLIADNNGVYLGDMGYAGRQALDILDDD